MCRWVVSIWSGKQPWHLIDDGCDRWFAYVSETEECLLEDVLITPVSSFPDASMSQPLYWDILGPFSLEASPWALPTKTPLPRPTRDHHRAWDIRTQPTLQRRRLRLSMVHLRKSRLQRRPRRETGPLQEYSTSSEWHELPEHLRQYSDQDLLCSYTGCDRDSNYYCEQSSFCLWQTYFHAQWICGGLSRNK